MNCQVTTVYNLSNGDKLTYSVDPVNAVIAAYAQSLGDWSTWDYAKRYADMVIHGKHSVSIGDFAAKRVGQ